VFQRFTDVLFGDLKDVTNNNQDPEFAEKEEEEWILVDYIDNCTNCSGEEADTNKPEKPTDYVAVFSSSDSSLDLLVETSDSCCLQFDSCPLEESWFITPPPCFTAVGHAAVQVETSPMENLLIEHPSMSVYAVHNLRRSLKETSSRSAGFEKPDKKFKAAQNNMDQNIRCYAAALTGHSTHLKQTKSVQLAQKEKGHFEKHLLNRNSLRRQNLARDCQSRQTKPNGFLVHQPCQRQYNY
uniref:Tumor protein p53 inducible nuclear protein 1 n=1 Tax=Latimeria chalumnae TaxID=7897 RepID=H2ZTH1_LATCH